MAGITKQQIAEIRKKTRAANRRIERASEGARRGYEYLVGRAYGDVNVKKWSSAYKGMSYQQAQAQIEKLNRFLESDYTKIRGWRALKEANVSAALRKIAGRQKGFNLSQEELDKIFKQFSDTVDISDEELAELHMSREEATRREKYRVINLMVATKQAKGAFSAADISEAMADKFQWQKAYRAGLNARKANIKARENEGADIPF